MMNDICPSPESLFEALAEGQPSAHAHLAHCLACAALVEAHEGLEQELFRVSDPLPPYDFVPSVMALIEASPTPLAKELRRFVAIAGAVVVALGGIYAVPLSQPLESLGYFTRSLLTLRTGLSAFAEASAIIWRAAALPLTLTVGTFLMLSMLALWRVSSSPRRAEVTR